MITRFELTVSMLFVFVIIAALSFVSLEIMKYVATLVYQIFWKG